MTKQTEHPTPAVKSADHPAPEWDEETQTWGHWVDDPEDATQEVWVPVEAKPEQSNANEKPVDGGKYGRWLNPPPPDPGRTKSLEKHPERRCTARRTNGLPCRKWAVSGSNVCSTHGGAAPQVKAKARARLENAADRMAKELLKIAVSDNMPAYVKLDAIKDALDRGGVPAKTAIEVEVGPTKPWEQVFSGIVGGSRADARAARSVEQDSTDQFAAHRAMMEQDRAARALDVGAVRPADDYLDAEVVPADQPSPPKAAIDRTPASIETANPAQFVREANAKAANTKPRHT